jgi:hypothetical protein
LMDRFLLNKEEEVTLEKFRTRATSSSYSIKIT